MTSPINNSQNKIFNKASDLFCHLTNSPTYKESGMRSAHALGVGDFIYRGQINDDWPLLPSAFRSGDIFHDFSPQSVGIPNSHTGGQNDVNSHLGWHIHAELRSCIRFLDHAENLGINTPFRHDLSHIHTKLINNLFDGEDPLTNEFFPDGRLLPWLAFSQHHGIPTRLLDFTRSPLIAMFFCAYGASTFCSNKPKNERLSIYCLDVSDLKNTPEIEIVRTKVSSDSFIRAQQGVFVLMTGANDYFLKNTHWPSLNDLALKSIELGKSLHKLTLPASEADELLRILHRFSVTQHTVFPSLAHAAQQQRYIKCLFGSQVSGSK